MSFAQFLAAFDDMVARARAGKLGVADFQGTTISLTNPGTVGTMASMPRLVAGQGAIIAVGAMDYPAEYRGAAADVIASLGISKVMSVTCTYDHRIIQGAESGMFLGTLQSLLDGEQNYYDEIFEALRIPYAPVKWAPDKSPDGLAPVPEPSAEVVRKPRRHASDQRVSRARASDGRPRSTGRRADLQSGTGSVDLRSDHLGSGPLFLHRFAGARVRRTQRRRLCGR